MLSAICSATVATVNGRKNFNQHLKKLSSRNWIEELIQKASTRRAAASSSGLHGTNHRFLLFSYSVNTLFIPFLFAPSLFSCGL